MRFVSTLIPATLARRYKRFLADVVLENGDMLTVHVANPGAMTGLDRPFSRVWLSNSENPMRKLPYNWELVEVDFGTGPELVGVNTSHPNVLVAEVIETGLIPQLRDYASVRREVKYGLNSRFDFLLEGPGRLLLDCGPGVLAKLREREAWPQVDAIAITHWHLDHWGDLVPWVWGSTLGPGEGIEQPELWVPPEGRELTGHPPVPRGRRPTPPGAGADAHGSTRRRSWQRPEG